MPRLHGAGPRGDVRPDDPPLRRGGWPKRIPWEPKTFCRQASQNLRALREREVIGETARERSDEKVRRLSPETRADQRSGQFSWHRPGLIAALCKRTSCERKRDKSHVKSESKSTTPLRNCACESPLLREHSVLGYKKTRFVSARRNCGKSAADYHGSADQHQVVYPFRPLKSLPNPLPRWNLPGSLPPRIGTVWGQPGV